MKTCLIIPALLLSTLVQAYTAVENRSLDADGIRALSIRTYSGPLSIIQSDTGRIEVKVMIEFYGDWDDEEALEALDEGLVLALEGHGSQAELKSWVGDYDVDDVSFFTWGLIDLFRSGLSRPFSHLEVRVPEGIDLEINDYRGEIIVADYTGDLHIRTGAGVVNINGLDGDLELEDGADEIVVRRVSGDVEIRDFAGDIEAEEIGGKLTIHDGAGDIEVHSVGGFLDIRDGGGRIRISELNNDGDIYDGAGEIDIREVKGSIALTDGGGGVDISGVEKDLVIYSRGGGPFNVRNIGGEVIDHGRGRRRNDNYFNEYRRERNRN